jgi:glutamate racemase
VSDPRPIGIFDSGIGGLTVLSALHRRLPTERFLYLGDTARLPYGTKSSETIVRYALRAARFLVAGGIKMLVVACNTATSAALEVLVEALPIPVIGVVKPGAREAAAIATARVGVIGTESTVASGAYVRAIQALRADLEVVSQPCPLFVPLAEEGWLDHPVTHEVARIYLAPVVSAGIDTLILGCTHYPMLRGAIAAAAGRDVRLVSPPTDRAKPAFWSPTARRGSSASPASSSVTRRALSSSSISPTDPRADNSRRRATDSPGSDLVEGRKSKVEREEHQPDRWRGACCPPPSTFKLGR